MSQLGLFIDSFDHYTDLTTKWTNSFAAGIQSNIGRNGAGCLITAGGFISKTLSLQSNISIGFAYKLNPGQGNMGGLVYTLEAINTSGSTSTLCQVLVFADGTFGLYAGNNTLIDNPQTFVCTPGKWMFVEINVQLSGSTPIQVQMTLKVNGNVLTNAISKPSNVNSGSLLCNSAKGNYHTIHSAVGNGNVIVDDLYVTIGSTFLGDNAIFCIYPRQDVTIGCKPNIGATRYNLIKEHPPDDDTTYIYSNTLNDLYTAFFDTVPPLTGPIKMAQLSIYARKDDEGSRAIVDAVHGGSFVGSNNFYLGDTYYYHTFPYDNDPSTGNPWTPAIVNAQDFGVKLIV